MKQLELILEILKQNRRNLKNKIDFLIGDKNSFHPETPVVLLDEVSHGNLGDQAIAYAEHQFIKKHTGYNLSSLLDFEATKCLKALHHDVENHSSILFFHGGGNFGTLYPSAESFRRTVLKKFPDVKIIMFPQSIFFSNDKKGNYELELSSKIYSNRKNLLIFAREPRSYEIIKNNFKNKVFLVPDIVFSLDITERLKGNRREGVITLFRNDQEKKISAQILTEINKYLTTNFKKITDSDTHIGPKYNNKIDSSNREEFLFEKWNEIADHELAITDRLHGMIFSYITKTPCIVFENNNHKIRETYDYWLKDCNYIEMVSSFEDFKSASEKLSKIKPKMKDFSKDFSTLANEINIRFTS